MIGAELTLCACAIEDRKKIEKNNNDDERRRFIDIPLDFGRLFNRCHLSYEFIMFLQLCAGEA